jgi:hypothetical protein
VFYFIIEVFKSTGELLSKVGATKLGLAVPRGCPRGVLGGGAFVRGVGGLWGTALLGFDGGLCRLGGLGGVLGGGLGGLGGGLGGLGVVLGGLGCGGDLRGLGVGGGLGGLGGGGNLRGLGVGGGDRGGVRVQERGPAGDDLCARYRQVAAQQLRRRFAGHLELQGLGEVRDGANRRQERRPELLHTNRREYTARAGGEARPVRSTAVILRHAVTTRDIKSRAPQATVCPPSPERTAASRSRRGLSHCSAAAAAAASVRRGPTAMLVLARQLSGVDKRPNGGLRRLLETIGLFLALFFTMLP